MFLSNWLVFKIVLAAVTGLHQGYIQSLVRKLYILQGQRSMVIRHGTVNTYYLDVIVRLRKYIKLQRMIFLVV
jgi:hypothetical protein